MKNKQLRDLGLNVGVVCTSKKQVRSLLSKKNYKRVKDWIQPILEQDNTIAVFRTTSIFCESKVVGIASPKYYEYSTTNYNPNYKIVKKELKDG